MSQLQIILALAYSLGKDGAVMDQVQMTQLQIILALAYSLGKGGAEMDQSTDGSTLNYPSPSLSPWEGWCSDGSSTDV